MRNLSCFVDGITGLLQGIFLGKLHAWELSSGVMIFLRVLRVFDQCVIALPKTGRELVKFHLNFDAFVDGLNHETKYHVTVVLR